MAIKLKYDPVADRMRLWVQQPHGAARVFWLRRNQCLALLARLTDVAREMGVEPKAVEPLKAPPPRPRKDPAIDEALPENLDGLRVRVDGEDAAVQLVHDGKGLGLKFQAPGITRLQEMLATQAERAGWDPLAGVNRLKAMAQARAAIGRSKSGNTGT